MMLSIMAAASVISHIVLPAWMITTVLNAQIIPTVTHSLRPAWTMSANPVIRKRTSGVGVKSPIALLERLLANVWNVSRTTHVTVPHHNAWVVLARCVTLIPVMAATASTPSVEI